MFYSSCEGYIHIAPVVTSMVSNVTTSNLIIKVFFFFKGAHTQTVPTGGRWPQVVSYTTFPLLLTCRPFYPFSSSFSCCQLCPAGLPLTREKKENRTDHTHTQSHICTHMWTHTHTKSGLHLSLCQCTHTHWCACTHTQTPKQIKAYPPTVVVALQDDEGSDPKYQLISADQWLTSQPAIARLTNTA